MADKPTVVAVLIADHVYRDGLTGKSIIAGTFDRIAIAGQNVPGHLPSFFLYLKLVDITGPTPLKIEVCRFESLGQDSEVMSMEVTIQNPPGMSNLEAAVQLPPIPIEQTSEFRIKVYIHGEYETSASLEAVVIPEPPQES